MNIKKVLSIFLVLALMLGTVPGMSFAVQAEDEPAAETVSITPDASSGTMTVTFNVPERDPVPYIDADGTVKQTGPDCYDVYTTDTSLGIASTEQWYVVREDTTLTAEVSLKILGDFRLILCDGATLTVPHGINLDNGSITIYAQSTDEQTMGKLVANAHDGNCAAIGSSASKTPGAITINGGNITATGGANSAAIGAGSGSTNVNVTINGGVVTATGGANSAAIGAGSGSTNVNVTINDGTVTANGSENGAAISGSVNISGGTVNATGGSNGAAISGNITVSGGTVTADGVNGAAIDCDLTVDGGTVNVTGGENTAAINGNLTLNDGTVTVDGVNGAAIGGSLTFNGGTVTATGVPALSGSATLVHYMPIKAGDSADTAVNTDADQLTDEKYIHIDYIPEYTITWQNYDGNVLGTTKVLEGDIPTTDLTPTKAADEQNFYEFNGWSPAPVAVTGDATYTATYKAVKRLTIAQGQYIRLGYYNGKPVDWYCQRINGTGTMMLSKYALKASRFGDNATYKTSDVHSWLDLNSGGTFATDLGLTSAELSIVRTVDLSGSAGDGTDSFIIPAYANDELNKGVQVHAPYQLGTNTLVPIYWLRTARDTSNARVVNHSQDGSPIATVAARYSGVGNSRWIRPMFYLDTDAIKNLRYTGAGTEADPYVFESRYSVSKSITPDGSGNVNATARRDGKTIYIGALPATLASGAEITLTAVPATGYDFKSFTVTDADDTPVTVTNNKFTMPEKAVNVTAEFKKQQFDVTWKNYDGTVLRTDRLEYGTVPAYDGDEPTKYSSTLTGWTDGKNTYSVDDPLPMVTANVTYTAVFTFNDGVGERVAGHTLSLEGDIAVNFYMELEPAIAASETAYMHFTIPNGKKKSEVDVPVSQAIVKGNYYVFKCNVAAKDMNATIKGRIIDGEKLGDEYTYSVRDYADYLFANADENGTDAQKAYAAAVPLVEKMLNYGAYAQKHFAPKTTDEDLSNVGHEVDISGVTADTIGKSAYFEYLKGVAEFIGSTLSLKSQTTLSLYFKSDNELTFDCAHEFETENMNDYQIIRIRNIAAKDLRKDFSVTVSAGESRRTVTYSPMNYCYNVLNGEQSETLQNVCKALYLYAAAANDYFNEPVAPAHIHTPGAPVHKNEVAATCISTGSYDEHVYCTECGEELSRDAITTDIGGHNIVAVAETTETLEAPAMKAHFECTVCHKLFTDAEGNNETTLEDLLIPRLNVVLDEITEDTVAQDGAIITGELTGNYKISIADGATVTLKDADTTCLDNDAYYAGITLLGDATILLEGTSTVKGGNMEYPGIYVPENKTLIIDGTGSLDTSSNGDASGIGGGSQEGNAKNSGNIIINGGDITAYGDCSAGIGSGFGGSCGDITINGGNITATGSDGAGIGSAWLGSCGNITINGGTINATGEWGGAGIGSGSVGKCVSITITGGSINAYSESDGAGIGSGSNGECGNITITGGTVHASYGEEGGNNIGAGCDGECGTINIGPGANIV